MTTTTTTTEAAVVNRAFSDAERYALAAFLAGYRGLTREAYALDLRQFTAVHEGNGLTGMRERLAALGGDLCVDSRPSHGFTVNAHIPPTASTTSEPS